MGALRRCSRQIASPKTSPQRLRPVKDQTFIAALEALRHPKSSQELQIEAEKRMDTEELMDAEKLMDLAKLGPVGAIEASVLDGFGDVFGFDVRGVFDVCDGTGNFQDAVVSAGAESLLGHGALQQTLTVGGEFTEGADMAGRHLGVAVDLFAGGGEALELLLAGADHAFANFRGALGFIGGAHLFIVHGRNIDVDVNAIHQRTRDF
jgi:hypothetical protein